jgi:single-strand DNA-binding protein
MNKVVLIGRLTKDLELKQNGEVSVIKFTLAVNRKFVKQGEERQADFINCVAFNKTAITMTNFLEKGRQIAVEGRIQTGSYKNKEGATVYTTEVIVDSFYFADSKKTQAESDFTVPDLDDVRAIDENGFYPVDDGKDELPF